MIYAYWKMNQYLRYMRRHLRKQDKTNDRGAVKRRSRLKRERGRKHQLIAALARTISQRAWLTSLPSPFFPDLPPEPTSLPWGLLSRADVPGLSFVKSNSSG
jgi:hypothetical protein